MSALTEFAVPVAIGATTGIGTGLLSTLAAQWGGWAVEKRRLRTEAQRRIIADVRNLIEDRQTGDRRQILVDPRYLAVRRLLRPETERKLRDQSMIAASDPYGTGGNPYLALLRDETDWLEKEWRLS